jgi:hypothetical protein
VNTREALQRTTPLHEAAIWGFTDVLVVLLQSGADPTVKDCSNRTPREMSGVALITTILEVSGKAVWPLLAPEAA